MPEAFYVFIVLGGVGLVVAGVVRWAYGRRSS
jgi:hypothetical protein